MIQLALIVAVPILAAAGLAWLLTYAYYRKRLDDAGLGVEDEPTMPLAEVFVDADDPEVLRRAITALDDLGFDALALDPTDPVRRAFDEADRLVRGECDDDIVAVFDRSRLAPYEREVQTARVRRLTRRLSRLDQT